MIIFMYYHWGRMYINLSPIVLSLRISSESILLLCTLHIVKQAYSYSREATLQEVLLLKMDSILFL